MSTRCTIHFCDPLPGGGKRTQAIVYRHSDGYPSGAGTDLHRFLADVKANVADTRFDQPDYLAAKYVVWQAAKYAHGGYPLDFLGVGVCLADPCDIEFRYYVLCGREPRVECWLTGWSEGDNPPDKRLCDVPLPGEETEDKDE